MHERRTLSVQQLVLCTLAGTGTLARLAIVPFICDPAVYFALRSSLRLNSSAAAVVSQQFIGYFPPVVGRASSVDGWVERGGFTDGFPASL